ncbi:MAG: helix-hairpin-helix domain-containing protein [Bacteroidota bacterium]
MPNETKKLKKLLKEYFVFSTGERKGIIWLLTILVLLISLPFFYGVMLPKQPLEIKITDLKSYDDAQKTFVSYHHETENKLFNFDPNIISDDKFSQLGFSKFNIKTIRNYLSKGGKFRKPEDVKKIFGVKPELFQKIEPFIVFNTSQNNNHSFSDSTKTQKKFITKKVVEINSADSVELVGLYRIGPATASRIIDYRNKLGGFLKLEQLTEIWGFDEDVLYDLNGKVTVDASKAIIYNINKVSADELKTHPYFKYKLSNAIVNYRKQHGNFVKMDDLKNIVLINDSIYKRITLYLKLN